MRVRTGLTMLVVGSLLLLNPLPAQAAAPGDVVSATPTTVYLAPGKRLEVPVNAWQLRYRSTTATGAPTVVSGTLLVPKVRYPLGKRPVVGYAVGTHGLGDQCAPSRAMARGAELELTVMSLMLLKGWAVAVTDYEGLGTPGDHTYMAGRSQGQAVLDSVRAATRLPAAKVASGGPVLVMGYSQGGSAAGWAGELHASYAPELKLKGVAAGGVPADLKAVADHLDGGPDFGLAAAAGLGLDAAYPELALASYLTPEGNAIFTAARGHCIGDIRAKLRNRTLKSLTTTDLLNLPVWRTRLQENRLGATKPSVPLFIYHAKDDEIIPISVSRTLRRAYCAQNTTLLWTSLPAPSHVLGAAEGAPLAIAWLASRLLGLPAIGNC
ncbi:lipase family protein [Acrocarpospora catenulata]|uniref:lipase family protein n=1 Tax=Acrocarpospora catenulata TaxID=2836182 RepID=UPI001BD9A4F5|nr:lipase family protein [Acrocarpospora catenulata]